jgi:hypothetical protein
MDAYISAADFGLRTWPPEKRLVALLGAYFDDSQSTGDVWAVAGYVGYRNQWDHFETLWRAALAKHGVPYFHMREMANKDGPFAKWLPHEDHQDEVLAFFTDLVDAIRRSHLRMIASAVWLGELIEFNDAHGLSIEPYPLAAFACQSQIAMEFADVPATAVFDRVEKVDDKLNKARLYAKSDPNFYPNTICDSVASFPIPKGVTFRETPALQAADFICWEFRKAIFHMKEWQLSADRPRFDDRDELWKHYREWHRKNTGKDPFLRKSLGALISEMPTHGVVWDLQQLSAIHKFRRGCWTLEAAALATQQSA